MTTTEKNLEQTVVSAASLERKDPIKWFFGIALLGLAIYGNVYFKDAAFLYRVVGVFAISVVALVVLSFTVPGQKFIGMLKECRIEWRKIVWPTRQETFQTTVAVVVMVLVVAVLLWLVDTFLGWLILKIIG